MKFRKIILALLLFVLSLITKNNAIFIFSFGMMFQIVINSFDLFIGTQEDLDRITKNDQEI